MENNEKEYNLIKFVDGDFSLDVKVDYDIETVWLSREQLGLLYERDIKTIGKHVNNLLSDELDGSVVAFFATTASDGKSYKVAHYNLDMITLVGQRIRSKRLPIFKAWCDSLFYNQYSNHEYGNMAISSAKRYELVEFKDGDFSLNVSVSPDEDTVWLTQADMALLFDVDRTRITRHINSIFEEFELDEESNVRKTHFPFSDKDLTIYSLEVVIAVGYRVKSKRGIIFRRWASSVLKHYLLKGYLVNEDRCLACTSSILSLSNKVIDMESQIKDIKESVYSTNEKLILEGDLVEPYIIISKIFFLAKNELIIIDPYADKFLLSMLSDIKVNITIITSTKSYINKEAIPNNVSIIHNDIYHDRFIISDDNVYLFGTSFNDIGKKRFMLKKLETITKEMLLKI